MYWGCVVMGISMFLSGGFSRVALQHQGNPGLAAAWGAAGAAFTFIFTFGYLICFSQAQQFTDLWLGLEQRGLQSHGFIPQRFSHCRCAPRVTPGEWSGGASGMDGR